MAQAADADVSLVDEVGVLAGVKYGVLAGGTMAGRLTAEFATGVGVRGEIG